MVRSFIRKSLAVKITLNIAIFMVVLLTAMGIFLGVQQRETQTEVLNRFLYAKSSLASQMGARAYSAYLEQLVDTGMISVREVFDKDYQLIEGYDWAKNPKYHTAYDTLTDNGVLLVEDAFLSDSDFVFAVGVDVNGYLPTHNSVYQKKLTGDLEKDLVGNRTKRIFDDPVGIKAARNLEVGFRQVYERDTGETLWDVSTPVYVKGRHWGGFRIGVKMSQVEAQSATLMRQLITFFAALTVLVLGALFYLLNRNMGPVRDLAGVADSMSSGETLDKPITTDRVDEIGMLSNSLERMRVSMKAAIERLTR